MSHPVDGVVAKEEKPDNRTTEEKIVAQMNFWLSDKNLRTDKFLISQMDAEGCL